MNCEMCGKDAPLFTALVEGINLKLCKNCSSMGKVLSGPPVMPVKTKTPTRQATPSTPAQPETVTVVVPDFGQRIHKARERMGLTQKEFALKINEKESFLSKLEGGEHEPSIETCRKLERLLHIKLIEEREAEKTVRGAATGGAGMTIGDILKR